jgi:hypothetical protein
MTNGLCEYSGIAPLYGKGKYSIQCMTVKGTAQDIVVLLISG